ncbi:unnamed protein product, partial [Discosporangium mesarthrocarpum]
SSGGGVGGAGSRRRGQGGNTPHGSPGSMFLRHEGRGTRSGAAGAPWLAAPKLSLATRGAMGSRLLRWCTSLCESPEWRGVFCSLPGRGSLGAASSAAGGEGRGVDSEQAGGVPIVGVKRGIGMVEGSKAKAPLC